MAPGRGVLPEGAPEKPAAKAALEGGQAREIDGVLMLPVRSCLESLGGTVTWQDGSGRAVLYLWSTGAIVWPGRATTQIDGRSVAMARAAVVEAGTLLVPVDLFDKAWGIEPHGGNPGSFCTSRRVRWNPFGLRPATPVQAVAARGGSSVPFSP